MLFGPPLTMGIHLQVGKRIVALGLGPVGEPQVDTEGGIDESGDALNLVDILQSLQVLGAELDNVLVLVYPGGGDGLGEDGASTRDWDKTVSLPGLIGGKSSCVSGSNSPW